MRQQYYNKCPHCGAHLDPGERCDCRLRSGEEKIFILEKSATSDTYFVWNRGGYDMAKKRGESVLPCGKKFEALKAYLSVMEVNGRHAMCKVGIGFHIITVMSVDFDNPLVNVYKIEEIFNDQGISKAICSRIYFMANKLEITDLSRDEKEQMTKAVLDAIGMAETQSNRRAFYIRK